MMRCPLPGPRSFPSPAWRRRRLLLLLVAAAVGVQACASGRYDHPALTSEPGEGAAELVILRKDELAMGAFALTVRADDEKLVALRPGRYAVLRLKPGTYRLTVDKPNDFMGAIIARMDGLELAPGSRTYIQLSAQGVAWGAGMGASTTGAVSSGVSATPDMGLHPIGEPTAKRLMKQYEAVGAD